MTINNKNVPYVIGETAYNHEGDIDYLRRMVDDIADIGLEAVKFHLLLDLESYMCRDHPLFDDMKQWMFSREQWSEIIDYSIDKGLDVVALCDDVQSIRFVKEKYPSLSSIELHATSLNDRFMLKEVSAFKGLIILGIGGSAKDEIEFAVDFLKSKGKEEIMLMYGYQSYPTNYGKINLSRMINIKEEFNVAVGYADHTGYDDPNNDVVSISAGILGFNVLEKHYTPDPGKERIDYQAAVGKEQMSRIKGLLSLSILVRGDGSPSMSDDEALYGKTGPMKKAIVARVDIKQGEKISTENLWFKRTKEESHLKQSDLSKIIGLTAIDDIEKDSIIDINNLK